ncbi:4Fe-4S binding protein [Bacillus smithii]|uniref:4Fe-4S binding protein n=1 Tax=Bacillus smithii TaxID=1479 RepID=UPI002E20C118|nr:4Fe-4S binding protein [Bacillus smithii]
MSRIFKQKESKVIPKLFSPNSPPTKIIYKQNEPAKIMLENNEVVIGSCLKCTDTPCLNYQEEELINNAFPAFPQDNAINVCPTEAITLDADAGSPTIDASRCIACGLCAARCPSGAIYFKKQIVPSLLAKNKKEEIIATVNTEPSKYIKEFDELSQQDNMEIVKSNKLILKLLPKEGNFIDETDEIFKGIYDKIFNLSVDAQFPNILTRNLLLQTGISCSIRRKGDVNLRMDAVLGPPGTDAGVLEVELASIGILDSPRNMLDNIAVLHSRYGIETNTLTPLIVSMSLPNTRTEYYRVINDIKNVLNLKINTLTIGALFIFVWNNKLLDLRNSDFYVDSEHLSIRDNITARLGRKINLSEGFYSILEAGK